MPFQIIALLYLAGWWRYCEIMGSPYIIESFIIIIVRFILMLWCKPYLDPVVISARIRRRVKVVEITNLTRKFQYMKVLFQVFQHCKYWVWVQLEPISHRFLWGSRKEEKGREEETSRGLLHIKDEEKDWSLSRGCMYKDGTRGILRDPLDQGVFAPIRFTRQYCHIINTLQVKYVL